MSINSEKSRGTGAAIWTLDSVRARCIEEGDCWLWTLSLKDGGTQPQARINGRPGVAVRRWMYDVLLGKKRPIRSIVSTSCKDMKCCAPDHLIWSTRSAAARLTYVNGRRNLAAATELRRASAIRRGMAKITMEKAEEIRLKACSMSTRDIASEYGLTVDTIRAIVRNSLWKRTAVTSVFDWRP